MKHKEKDITDKKEKEKENEPTDGNGLYFMEKAFEIQTCNDCSNQSIKKMLNFLNRLPAKPGQYSR